MSEAAKLVGKQMAFVPKAVTYQTPPEVQWYTTQVQDRILSKLQKKGPRAGWARAKSGKGDRLNPHLTWNVYQMQATAYRQY